MVGARQLFSFSAAAPTGPPSLLSDGGSPGEGGCDCGSHYLPFSPALLVNCPNDNSAVKTGQTGRRPAVFGTLLDASSGAVISVTYGRLWSPTVGSPGIRIS